MEDKRPVFVLVTAKTCPGCVAFKRNTWDSLKTQLEKDGKVQIVTVEVPTTISKPDPVKYHKELGRFIQWFPTIALFPADRWYNHNSELIGIVKNGKMVPPGTDKEGNFVPEHIEMVGEPNFSKDELLGWVDYTISKDRIFSSTPTNNKTIINKTFPNGNFMVPTASYYAKFKPSKVE